ETSKNVTKNYEMSQETETNVLRNKEMSQETEINVLRNEEMSQEIEINVLRNEEMSQENDMEFSEEDLQVPLLAPELNKRERYKKNKRQQGIVGLIRNNPIITMEELAEKLDVNERTIHRDMEELKQIVEHVGPTKGGYWRIKT
ncbi:MAG: HTH domain-containing protein, partial [Bacteroidales bacterium]|nr:HTH domain-containing protein [Bacteroidales bacterium]